MSGVPEDEVPPETADRRVAAGKRLVGATISAFRVKEVHATRMRVGCVSGVPIPDRRTSRV